MEAMVGFESYNFPKMIKCDSKMTFFLFYFIGGDLQNTPIIFKICKTIVF